MGVLMGRYGGSLTVIKNTHTNPTLVSGTHLRPCPRSTPDISGNLSGKFPGGFRDNPRFVLGNFSEISRTFSCNFPRILSDIFPDISGIFPGNLPEISRNCPGTFPEISRTFPGNSPDISLEISRTFPKFLGHVLFWRSLAPKI